MNMNINSTSNPKIKWVKSLHKNSTRREEGVFVVEGAKEIAMALDGGYLLNSLFVCPDIYGESPDKILKQVQNNIEIYSISAQCYEKITYRNSTNGILGVFQAKAKTLDELNFGDNPFFLIVESVEKPGNLGAIIRTADGAGADAVIVCDPKCDIFNPNVIRSSVGTVFTKQVVTGSSEEVFDFLQKHEVAAFGALLSKESSIYNQTDLTTPSAIVLGTEHEGLSKFWIERTKPIIIPMNGTNDSLNVSNAAAILAYEVIRQRS